MPAAPHDDDARAPDASGRKGEATAAPDVAAGLLTDAAERIRAAQRWLVAELRDECSDIGVSAHGCDLDGFLRGVRAFAREARRLGAPAERMLVLLKQCLLDQRLPEQDRERYLHYRTSAVSAAIVAFYEPADAAARAD
jgi:hypothetical protein